MILKTWNINANIADVPEARVKELEDCIFEKIRQRTHGADDEGKTVPRSLRHLPINDAAHVRNALARLNQTKISEEAKKSALKKIKAAAKKFGVKVSEADASLDYSELY